MPREGKPVIIPEWDDEIARIKVTVAQRAVTMLRPICDICQRGRPPEDWWTRCTHNKYISVVQRKVIEPVYEDEMVGDQPTGRKLITGQHEYMTYSERPNRVKVALAKRINSGALVKKKARRNGFIFPEDLRSPQFPYGIKNTCEFRDCFRQSEVRDYKWGRFCRDIEAQLVGFDARMDGGGGAMEVGDTAQSLEKQLAQLQAVPLH